MFSPLGLIRSALGILKVKEIKYFIDSTFRDKVVPVPGSVVYCDLWAAAEHSGIYVGKGRISNIVVDGVAESSVLLCGPESFTSKSTLGRRIYVSCDRDGAVGHPLVAEGAHSHVGERAFYGLVFKNCHTFSTRCVHYAGAHEVELPLWDRFLSMIPDETWEPTIGALKGAARKKLGATKWRLWDLDGDAGAEPPPEPDWQAQEDAFRNQKLDAESIAWIRKELEHMRDYEAEIADENLPAEIRRRLAAFRSTLDYISRKYDEVKDFLAMFPGATFSYADLQASDDDFQALARTMQDNAQIRELARRMGRDYIPEEKKKRIKVPQASRNEVHGTHRSDDLMRLLPSELLNLEDDTLELLFYSRLLEKNLLSYELGGTSLADGEVSEEQKKRTGPVVACLDTSGSMQGEPLLKAKALLLAIANILKTENRSLHVLLFGAAGEMQEFSMTGRADVPGLLGFLRQRFGGGTDFETPLRHAFDIIQARDDYRKADVLMISDGDCSLSPEFIHAMEVRKRSLNCMVYSVLCAGSRVEDAFSDAVMVL
jgi:uncharacterized protein with von Willebrand factor type A (vWA) domain